MNPLFALCAEFKTPEALVEATEQMKRLGYQELDAFVPFPIEALDEALPKRPNRVSLIALIGGTLGASTGFFMQWYANVVDYPIRVAGRPYNSWPAFIPITFELGVLGAAVFSVFGMLALNGLPRLHHPIFEAMDFDRASMDRFFLSLSARDPSFSPSVSRKQLLDLGALQVSEVFDHEVEA